MVECIYCKKHLKMIGSERKNGKTLSTKSGKDWGGRPLHKKCYFELKNNGSLQTYLKTYYDSIVGDNVENECKV
jgi:hypothetical protein